MKDKPQVLTHEFLHAIVRTVDTVSARVFRRATPPLRLIALRSLMFQTTTEAGRELVRGLGYYAVCRWVNEEKINFSSKRPSICLLAGDIFCPRPNK